MPFPRNKELIEDAESWLKTENEMLEGHYERLNKEEKSQGRYTSIAGWYLSIAITKFLRGDPIDQVRAIFTKSAECIEMSFVMSYDKESKHYLEDKAELARVSMTYAIKGMHSALAAGDFLTASRIAKWTQIPANELPEAADPENENILETNYSHVLKYILLEDPKEISSENKKKILEHCNMADNLFKMKKYKKQTPYRMNFGNRIKLVHACLKRDVKKFDLYMEEQLKGHIKDGQLNGELEDTHEAEIYAEGVALTNLARRRGMKPTFRDDKYLPEELLVHVDAMK